MSNTVKVPERFLPIFKKAQECVGRYFQEKKYDPSRGTIEICGERYILIRAAAMSVEFFETIAKVYEKEGDEESRIIAGQILFDIAHAIGRQDAKNFHKKMELKDPIEKLSACPVHFSHTGWAFVDIFPESRPSPDENYYLIYDHPYSFEASAWLALGKKSDFPVCIMNTGYSSGWCEESFGIALVTSEIMCQAKGDDVCRFIMAPPARIEGHIADYMKTKPKVVTAYEVPAFFKRKETEESLAESRNRYRRLVETTSDWVWEVDEQGVFTYSSPQVREILGYEAEEIQGKTLFNFAQPEDAGRVAEFFRTTSATRKSFKFFENTYLHKDGYEVAIETNGVPYFNTEGKFMGYHGINRDITVRKKTEMELKRVYEEIREKSEYLEKFNRLMVGRELEMIKLKAEVNDLLEKSGQAKKYEVPDKIKE